MKRRSLKKCGAAFLSAALLLSSVPTAFAGDTWPWEGDAAIAPNQPIVVGQRVYDLEFWGEDTEEGADLLTAKIPIQQRNDAFSPTQANPDLNYDAEIFNMQGDYGNSFFESTAINNEFSQFLFNYWQYVDYYASWHGVTTKGAPINQYDPEGAWQQRYFEFGLINMPNPAYTNAAHKNGAKSIGCIFLPRAGQTHASMIEKDENDEFPIAKKLIEFANYYGFDGYFINQEESIPSTDVPIYKEFTKYLIDNGIYVQWYDSITPSGGLRYQNQLNASNSTFIHDDAYGLGKVNSSLFVNYDWFYSNRVNTSLAHAQEREINPFTEVFFGVEANQGKLSGSHGSAREVPQIYEPGTKNLRASLALFTPTDWIQNALDSDLYGSDSPNKRADDGYQWMIAERERMYYSGVAQDPTNTGKLNGYENPEIGVSNASGWVGVADFAAERSVINGSTFYTNFNTGHGMEYYRDGQVANENEWSNMNIQDILPSWQWWLESDGTKLNVDFDYGQKFQKLNKEGANLGTGYTQVGGYNGGSSLVVNGNLDAENFLRLYKTDLSVNEDTKVSMTYNKTSATDTSAMEVGVIFKNDPDNVITFNVPKGNQQTEGWVTKEINLGDYAGEEIATIGINFKDGRNTIENYQMNIGELKVTDGSVVKPAVPTNFEVSKAYDTDEMIVTWDIADYSEVKQYNLYANLSDGSRVYLGGTYDDTYYIKSLYNEKEIVNLELKAVAEDGTESDAATTSYRYSDKVSNIQVDEKNSENDNKLQNRNTGYMDISWENPTADYESIELTVTPAKYWDYKERDQAYVKTVEKGVDSTRIMTPIADGSSYTLSMQVVNSDGTKGEPILYTGHFKDVYVEPFDEGYTVDGNKITFNIPKSEDWWHMYAYVDGEPLTFRSEYDTDKQYAIRGKSFIHNVTLPSASGVVEVVLEDYSGNRSAPAYLPYGQGSSSEEVDATTFPDEALLNAVKEQIGETMEEVRAYNGALDLSGTAIKDLTGLNKIANLSSVNLSNCKELVKITDGVFSGMNQLSEINITGCENLKTLKITGTSAEKLVYGDAADFGSLLVLDLSNNRFDMTAGTPERDFVDAIQTQIDEYDGPAITEPVSGNMALNGTITDDTKDDWETNFVNPGNVIDGDRVTEASANGAIGAYITVDLGSKLPVHKWAAYLGGKNGSDCYPSAFTILYSNDNENFTELETINQKVASVERNLSEPIEARYWKFRLDGRANWSSILTELELYADAEVEVEPSVRFGDQRPLVYPNIEDVVRLTRNNNGKPWDANEYYQNTISDAQTVRGTALKDLEGADFVKPDYDLNDAVVMEDIDLITVTDSDGNVSIDPIDTTKDGVYTVEYITYRDISLNGRVVYTQTIYVRAVTTVLEQFIAKAEQLLEEGALDNTMEAVVTEFHAALNAAKEIVSKDGATQQEINDATERLLLVMSKIDWKQGDKTVLQVAVDIANIIKPDLDLYVEEGKQEFLDALATAEGLLNSGNAWDDEIKIATDELMVATANLRMAPNKDILDDMINQAIAIDLSAYTADSAAAVRAALAEAEALAADANATQKAVDAAADTLKAALAGLAYDSGDANTPKDDNDKANSGVTVDTTPAPVGDGSKPTKTGDAGMAGFAGLAIFSAAGVLFALKGKKKN